MHPEVLRELACVITGCLQPSLKGVEEGGVTEDREAAGVSPVPKEGKEHPRNYRLLSPSSVPGKVVEQPTLESICRHHVGQEGDCK